MPEQNPVNGPPVSNSAPASAAPSAAMPPASAPTSSAPPVSAPPVSAPPGPTSPATTSPNETPGEVDLRWVWLEVRKRVFIKLPFSRQVAEVMEAAVPIALENNTFVCGLPSVKFPLSGFLIADQVKNTIEAILRQAAGHSIRFEVIDGTTIEDWQQIKQRRDRAHSAVIAMAEQNVELHHFEDVLNQVVGEIRHRVTSARDRNFPHVRAQLILDIVPQLSDAVDMLFPEDEGHDAGRVLARSIDRVATFLDLPPLTLALEMERYHREQVAARQTPARSSLATVGSSERQAPTEANSAH
jgi:hypothetical protein